jgi:Nineteen complex-related protein 2
MSKQRSLRKSKLSFADEEDEEDDNNGSVAIPLAAVKAAQQKQLKERVKGEKKSATLLSFNDGVEDGEGPAGLAITAKAISKGKSKSKPSLRIPPGSSVTLPAASNAYNTQVAAAGEYTAERLKELQTATKSAPRSMTQNTKGTAAAAAAAGMALPPPPSATVVIEEDEDMDTEDEGLGASIPDQMAIRAAKAKREQLRSGGAPDYIDLGVSAGRGRGSSLEPFAAGMKGTSATNKSAQKHAATKEEDEDVVMPAAAAIENDEDDQEEQAWAEEQIRKGIRSAELGTRSTAIKKKSSVDIIAPSTGTTGTAAGFLPPSQSAAVAAAADEVLSSLRAALQRAQLSQRQAEENLARTERSLEGVGTGGREIYFYSKTSSLYCRHLFNAG